jgi:hypothetical protein
LSPAEVRRLCTAQGIVADLRENLRLGLGCVMDLLSMEITVFSGEVIPLCRRLGSRVAALGA